MRELPNRRALFSALVAIALLLSGCARNSLGLFGERIDPTKVDEPADIPPTIMLQGQYAAPAPVIEQTRTFLGYLRSAAAEPQNRDLAAIFLKSGIALSDRMCVAWFEQLGQAQARAEVATDNLASLGALSATILGLAKADSRIIGGVAASFLFGKQILNADVAHYIIAADLGTVKGAIVKKRSDQAKILVATTFSESPRLDFWTAERLLIDYDDQCSHLAIKKFVSDSVAAEKVPVTPANVIAPATALPLLPAPSSPVAAPLSTRRFLSPRAAPRSGPGVVPPRTAAPAPAVLPPLGTAPINPNTVGSGYLLDPR